MVDVICPVCRAGYPDWKLVTTESYKSGVSGKKAILGGVLFGPVGGILGGLSGKKKRQNCMFAQNVDLAILIQIDI